MDIGGRKMAGFASGVIDSFQYYGTAIALPLTGWLIDHFGWGVWYPIMASFGAIGGVSMLMVKRKQQRMHAARRCARRSRAKTIPAAALILRKAAVESFGRSFIPARRQPTSNSWPNCSAKIPSPRIASPESSGHSTFLRRANAECDRGPSLSDQGNVRRANARRAAQPPRANARSCIRQIARPLRAAAFRIAGTS